MAWLGSLVRSSRRVSVVSKLPFGWFTDLEGSCVGARVDGAPCWRREMLAPVSMRAVVDKLGGLAQPEVIGRELTK
jgi:hypothetical protein